MPVGLAVGEMVTVGVEVYQVPMGVGVGVATQILTSRILSTKRWPVAVVEFV